ncbi:LysM peptidoglycan-binding domain-containing protein [Phytoactinopolyspora limicola]|uniref:LysM peptidoglycan-binding domain-containing protein n=1 Tax=Phytoactinopolyspora limicola TaxID=2715536 RepID=UPI00140A8013|nr:hypothetical protein [Phytoactinopolyspora limicola]
MIHGVQPSKPQPVHRSRRLPIRLTRAIGTLTAYMLALGGLWWATGTSTAAVLAGTATFDHLVAAVATLFAWALMGWLLLVAVVAVGGGARSRSDIPGRVVLGRIVPAAASRMARGMLGLTVIAVPFATSPTALAASTGIDVTSHCISGSLPDVGRPDVVVPDVGVPEGPSDGTPIPTPTAPPPVEEQAKPAIPDVTVEPGGSLWSIAAEHLGPDASDAEIAVEWPRWFAANTTTIGPDPDLIHPGQLLRPPPPL